MRDISIEELFNLNLFEAFSLEDISEPQRQEITEKASLLVLEEVVRRVSENMDSDARKIFFALFEDGASDEDRWKFLDEYVPNFEEILLEEILKFKAKALEFIEEQK